MSDAPYSCDVERTKQLYKAYRHLKLHGIGNDLVPGTPDALGSLWMYFMCSMSASPLEHSFWQMGQQLGLGPPTSVVCCKHNKQKHVALVHVG